MISRTLLTGLLAGLMAGVVLTIMYLVKTQPLILQAELYEHGAALAGQQAAPLSRILETLMFNVLTGAAFGLILSAVLTLRGRPVGLRQGVIWGAAGFVVFALAPGFGLPPELPGSVAAQLEARQLWWLLTAAATAVGMGLLAFAGTWPARLAGAALIVLPHIVGAPHPHSPGGAVPPGLAAQFVAVSLGANALFWVVLGASSGYLHDRFALHRHSAAGAA
ncbi:MAG: CbtA family protein [Alphaproteobacteria bacterium]|nr:CbtA family protein [Alphaproteobacteria bacterium]